MASYLLRAFVTFIIGFSALQAQAVEFRGEEYKVYLGDVNGDGIDDIYLHVPDVFVLIHGDISIPLLITSDLPSYLIASVDVNNPYYSDPVVDETVDISTMVLASESDVEALDLNGDGILDLQISSSLLLYSFVIDGNSETFISTTPAPPVDPNYYTGVPLPSTFVQPAHDSSVGALAGEHSVEQNGAAGYTIPINITGGRAGIQPGLSLNYNSGGGSNNALGLGWTVSGFSSIQRCPNNKLRGEDPHAVDYSSADKFCLDGVRLVVISGAYGVSGSEYRKENDDGTKVLAYGQSGSGPLYFKVWSGNGLMHEYGNTAESRVVVPNSSVATWAMNRTEDRYSNYLTISYDQPAGSNNYRPSRIDYTGNSNASVLPTNSVVFKYAENRSDPSSHYLGGVETELTWTMSRIEIYSESTLLRDYRFTYQNLSAEPFTSMLASVQICTAGVCMEPTRFNWSEESFGYSSVEKWMSEYESGIRTRSYNAAREQYIDVNGDGFPDRIWSPESGDGKYYVAINNAGEGFNAPVSWHNKAYYAYGKTVLTGSHDGENEWYVDINGDGLSDRVWEPSDGNDDYYWAKNTGSEFSVPQRLFYKYVALDGGGSVKITSSHNRQSFIDLNNDGYPDRIWATGSDNSYFVALNTGNGNFSAPVVWLENYDVTESGETIRAISYKGRHEYYSDMNGDGYIDRLWKPEGSEHLYVALNNGHEFYHISRWLSRDDSPQKLGSWDGAIESVIDLNGDGLPDWVWVPDGGSDDYYVALNNGTGFETPVIWHADGAGGVNAVSYHGTFEQYTDVNADGLPDRVWRPHGGTAYYAALNTGSSFGEPIIWQGSSVLADDGYIVSRSYKAQAETFIDLNGDGYPDRVWSPEGVNENYYVAFTKPNPRRIESIVSGNGGSQAGHTTSFYYLPGTDTEVHQRSPQVADSHPTHTDNSAGALVRRVTTSNGVGGVLTTEYSYKESLINVAGHGSLGFASMTTTNVDNGISTTTYFDQNVDNKIRGSVGTVITRFEGRDISVTRNIWENVDIGSGESLRHRMALLRTDIVKRDLNGAFMSGEYNVYTYTSYGLPDITQSQLHSEYGTLVRTKITDIDYTSFNVGDHILPMMNQSTVSVTVSGQPTLRSVSSWEYHPSTAKKLKERTLHPDTLAVLSETEYHNIDVFGNHLSTTVRGADFTERASTVVFDSSGRNVLSASNAYGHSGSKTYYSDNSFYAGLVDVSTGINGVRSKFYYDVFGRVTRTVKAYGTSNPISAYRSLQWCADIAGTANECHSNSQIGDSVYIYRMTSSSDGGAGQHVFVDKLGREVKASTQSIDGRFLNVLNHYDALGRNHIVSDPFFEGTAFDDLISTRVTHDAMGRVVESIEDNGVRNTVTFNGLVRISINDVDGDPQSKTEIRNSMNKVVKVIDNDLNEATYVYDSLGNLISVTDSESNTTTITYDAFSRKVEMDDLDKGLWKYTFNALGQLISQTNAKQETSCMVYDLLGRMTRRYDNYSGSVSRELGGNSNAKNSCASAGSGPYSYWDFDSAPNLGLGKLHRSGSSDGNYLITNHYDAEFGRVVQTDERIDGTTYSTNTLYDGLHRAAILTYPGVNRRVRVESVYNNLGFQVQLQNADDTTEVFYSLIEVDAQGNPLEEIFGNGVKTLRRFEPVTNRVVDINSWLPLDAIAPSIQELDFTFDIVGNLTARIDHIQNISETYEYDTLNRLTDMHADFGNGELQDTRVEYDALGNITYKSGVGSYSYGGTCNGRTAGPHAVERHFEVVR